MPNPKLTFTLPAALLRWAERKAKQQLISTAAWLRQLVQKAKEDEK